MNNPDLGLDAKLVVHRDDGFSLDITLTIKPGTTAALLGPNGAGKSTTIDTLAGLLPLKDGLIRLAGRVLDDVANDIFLPPEQRRIGVVFQRYLLFEHMSVLDNIAFGPASSGQGRRSARQSASRWVEALHLEELVDRRPKDLSGGEAQRVALARALATEPDLLLLDEPLAALDVGTRNELRRLLIRHLDDYAGPRLLITHDPADAFLLADEIHILEAGRIVQSGTPEQIRQHPATAYVAALAGTNLLTGTNHNGAIDLDEHSHGLRTSDTHTNGPVLITVHPAAISLHLEQPHGSPRNTWLTTIASIEPLGDTTRITLADPLPLGVDITPASTAALKLEPGSPIWASVKATEIGVSPA